MHIARTRQARKTLSLSHVREVMTDLFVAARTIVQRIARHTVTRAAPLPTEAGHFLPRVGREHSQGQIHLWSTGLQAE